MSTHQEYAESPWLFGVNTFYNMFLMYCVANTLAPRTTKRIMLNAAWWTLELYTVANMTLTNKWNHWTESIMQKYPVVAYLNSRTKAHTHDSEVKPYCLTKCSVTNLTVLEETVTGRRRVFNQECAAEFFRKEFIDDGSVDYSHLFVPVGYKLLACCVGKKAQSNEETTKVRISLESKNNKYDYYVNGNNLMSRDFLEFYAENHLDSKSREGSLLKELACSGDYTVSIIDNQCLPIVWNGEGKSIELLDSKVVVVSAPITSQQTTDVGEIVEAKDKTI